MQKRKIAITLILVCLLSFVTTINVYAGISIVENYYDLSNYTDETFKYAIVYTAKGITYMYVCNVPIKYDPVSAWLRTWNHNNLYKKYKLNGSTWDLVSECLSPVPYNGIVLGNVVLNYSNHDIVSYNIHNGDTDIWYYATENPYNTLQVPENITLIEVKNDINNEITLSWDEVESVTEYEIAVNNVDIYSTTQSAFTYSATSEGQVTFNIRSKDGDYISAWSEDIIHEIDIKLIFRGFTIAEHSSITTGKNYVIHYYDSTNSITYGGNTIRMFVVDDTNSRLRINQYTHNYWGDTYYWTGFTSESPGEVYELDNGDWVYKSANPAIWYCTNGEHLDLNSINKSDYIYDTSVNIYTDDTFSTVWYHKDDANTINCIKDEYYYLPISGQKSNNYSKTFTIEYDPTELEVDDLSLFTYQKEKTAGAIAGTGINIISYTPGAIVFEVTKDIQLNEVWSGVVNIIKFKALTTGQTTVNLLK